MSIRWVSFNAFGCWALSSICLDCYRENFFVVYRAPFRLTAPSWFFGITSPSTQVCKISEAWYYKSTTNVINSLMRIASATGKIKIHLMNKRKLQLSAKYSNSLSVLLRQLERLRLFLFLISDTTTHTNHKRISKETLLPNKNWLADGEQREKDKFGKLFRFNCCLLTVLCEVRTKSHCTLLSSVCQQTRKVRRWWTWTSELRRYHTVCSRQIYLISQKPHHSNWKHFMWLYLFN